jgi:hypothetical protein
MRKSDYIRSKERVDSCLKLVGEALVALEPLRVQIPERFADRGLALIEDVTNILGFMAIITEDNFYASCTQTNMVRTEPDRIGKVVVDNVRYIELHYDKGSKVIANVNLVMNDNLPHPIFTEHWGKAKIPWYYDQEDLAWMFMNTGRDNGVTIGADPAILEFGAGRLCRNPDDPTKFYREQLGSKELFKTKPPVIVGFKNVSYGANNFSTKTGGSFYSPGQTSALAHPAERNERVEWFLRQ